VVDAADEEPRKTRQYEILRLLVALVIEDLVTGHVQQFDRHAALIAARVGLHSG
jgi:hypothetical protein